MNAIITRAEAKAQGLKRYFTGKPCPSGHVAEKHVSSSTCLECGNAKNKARYHADVEASRKRASAIYHGDLEKGRAARRDYYAKNKDRFAAYDLEKYAADPESKRAMARDWAKRNPDKRRAQNMKRKAMKRSGAPVDCGELNQLVMEEAASAARRRAEMHGEPFHVDHMVPLARGGKHAWDNIQVIPARLNLRKHDRMIYTRPGEWIAHA